MLVQRSEDIKKQASAYAGHVGHSFNVGDWGHKIVVLLLNFVKLNGLSYYPILKWFLVKLFYTEDFQC